MNRTLIVAGAFAALTVVPAVAADLPARPYTKAPVAAEPVYSWTGFYIGVNGGGHIGTYDNLASAPAQAAGPVQDPHGTRGKTAPRGGLFGAQVGYNFQVAPQWLIGVEGDWQWTGGKDTVCLGECQPGPNFDDALVVETSLRWLATVRGRAGFIHNDYLWYVTGGGAWGDVRQTITGFDADTTPAPIGVFSKSTTKSGWTVGGGVETAFAPNWTAKLEYLYVDLGTVSARGIMPLNGNVGFIAGADTRIIENIVRVGVNYKFGGGPVVARY
jgi:outer membrane immunogenic protein